MRAVASAVRALIACVAFWGWISLCFCVFAVPMLVKIMVPVTAVRRMMTRAMISVAWFHSRGLTVILRVLRIGDYHFTAPPPLQPDKSYLLICNHQSWVDILLLMECLRTRAPWPRFFLKRQLIWVPVIGAVCWALDFPFMRRYSREQIAANPELAGQDLAETRRACERYRGLPITMVNFVEGTRASAPKIKASGSPFRNLMKPRSGGVAFALGVMGEQFDAVIDVTFVYPDTPGGPDFWGFCAGRGQPITIDMQAVDVPPELRPAAYNDDPQARATFQAWMQQVWEQKDARITTIKARRSAAKPNTGAGAAASI